MSRSIDFEVASALSVQQIHAAFSEADYWVARLAAYGGGTGTLDSIDVGADGSVQVVTVQDLRAATLPKPLSKLYPRDLEIVQDEVWTLENGGLRAKARIEARGAPGSGTSAVVMSPSSNGSHLRCTATVKVKVPLVGGVIETMLSRQMADETPELLRFTAAWLNDNT